MNKKRVGKIKVSEEFYFDKKLIGEVFKYFLPIKIEILYYRAFELTGFCEKFKEIEDGAIIPYYDFIFTEINGKITTEIKRLVL